MLNGKKNVDAFRFFVYLLNFPGPEKQKKLGGWDEDVKRNTIEENKNLLRKHWKIEKLSYGQG